MIKIIRILFLALVLSGCAYEPIMLKKNYNFIISNIETDGEKKINEIIKKNLYEKTNVDSTKIYQIYFLSMKEKNVISSNNKGDPIIFKITINLNYKVLKNSETILKNNISKEITYNNINDKFELLKYEENLIQNLSEKFVDDILVSITTSVE